MEGRGRQSWVVLLVDEDWDEEAVAAGGDGRLVAIAMAAGWPAPGARASPFRRCSGTLDRLRAILNPGHAKAERRDGTDRCRAAQEHLGLGERDDQARLDHLSSWPTERRRQRRRRRRRKQAAAAATTMGAAKAS